MSQRIDKILVHLKYVETRTQAQQLIKKGAVYYQDKLIKKSSYLVENNELIVVKGEIEFVGRGAYKIKGASELFKIIYSEKVIADIGASTGGFTDFALKNGASKVFAIDVGHDQLAKKIKENSKVTNMEGINIRFPLELEEKVDIAVVDLSYISLKLTLTTITSLLKDGGIALCLVKPQFEIGKEALGKNGIVKSSQDHFRVLEELMNWCSENNIFIEEVCSSPIEGKTGNKEFFYLINNGLKNHKVTRSDLLKVSDYEENV